MVKIFEHRGLHVYLDSKSFDEIRVVGRWKKRESCGVLELIEGSIHHIRLESSLEGKAALPNRQMQEFEEMVSIYSEDILELWNRLTAEFQYSRSS